MSERNHRLLDAKMTKYLFPSLMLSMAMQLGNIVDTILVGNFLGSGPMSAIRVTLPVILIEQIPGNGLAAGAAICAGILLGRRDRKSACAVFSNVFHLTVLVGALFFASAFFLTQPIVRLLTNQEELVSLAEQYLFIWLLGAPVIGVGLFFTNLMRLEGRPQLASSYIIVSNVVNLVLDYLFLAHTSLGIRGAALSSIIGYLAGMLVYIPYFTSKKKNLPLALVRLGKPLLDAAKTGMPLLILMAMTLVESYGANIIIQSKLGTAGMVVYTVCSNVLAIMVMFSAGITGVIPSLAGVLYGEKDYYGLRAICVRTLRMVAVVTAVVLAATLVFARQIAMLFGIRDEAMLEIMVPAMRCFMLCLPVYVWNRYLVSYYQSIRETGLASCITVLQNGTLMLPAAWICITLSQNAGGNGFSAMGLAFPIAQVLTALAIIVYRRVTHPGKGVFILPGENEGTCLDMTVKADPGEAQVIPRRIVAFGRETGVDPVLAGRMAVAAEEMTQNVIRYGGKASEWIDVCLNVTPKQLLLRIRDNGVPFDPTVYTFDGDDFEITGIEIVRRLASKISYVRAIDLNNTVIEINRQTPEEEKA